jgi:hypothetical protein
MKNKKYIFIFAFVLSQEISFAQNWAMMDGGLSMQFHAMYNDTISNKLYFHGGFQKAGNLTVNGTASWDGTKWDSLGKGVLGDYAWGPGLGFLIRYKNKLYVQGYGAWIYAWDFSTLKWDSIPKSKFNGALSCATIYNNEMYMGGQFTSVGGVIAKNVVRFDGTDFYPVGNLASSYMVRSIASYKNEIYIGSSFSSDTVYNGLARWNGSQWRTCGGGLRGGGGTEALSLCVYNNRLYVGGAFYGTKNLTSPSIAVWDTTNWYNIGGIHIDGFPWGGVINMFTFKNKLYAFGGFDWAGDQHLNAPIAIWNDTSWCGTKAYMQTTLWLATHYKNEIYVASGDYYLGTDSVNYVGRWNGGQLIDSCSAYTSIKTFSNPKGIKIYPNPVSNVLHIESEQYFEAGTEIKIVNILGQTVLKLGFNSEIDLTTLSSGYYTFKIISPNNETLISKFIKE